MLTPVDAKAAISEFPDKILAWTPGNPNDININQLKTAVKRISVYPSG